MVGGIGALSQNKVLKLSVGSCLWISSYDEWRTQLFKLEDASDCLNGWRIKQKKPDNFTSSGFIFYVNNVCFELTIESFHKSQKRQLFCQNYPAKRIG
jgi:hypothetical protein